MKKINKIYWIERAIAFAFIAAVLTGIFWEQVSHVVMRRTFDPPPKYTILTNGEKYKVKDAKGSLRYGVYTFRANAVAHAWQDYNSVKKKLKESKKMWEPDYK